MRTEDYVAPKERFFPQHGNRICCKPLFSILAAAAVVTVDTLLRDRLVRRRTPNNVERGGQTVQLHSTFVITKEILIVC